MRVILKTEDEISLMRKASYLISLLFCELGKNIKPGVTTLQLDRIAGNFVHDNGGVPVLKNKPCLLGGSLPANIELCLRRDLPSNQVVDRNVLHEGDFLSVTCCLSLEGFLGDGTFTFPVGEVSHASMLSLQIAKEVLYAGTAHAMAGNHLGDISYAMRSLCMQHGLSLYGKSVGSGIGRSLNEPPIIPARIHRGRGLLLKNSMCLTLSPSIWWGDKTFLGGLCGTFTKAKYRPPNSLFGHTIVVRKGESEILSSFDGINI